jgi:glyoxylase-like metal-dependent hydrolase (beta-lactamase superfamily II)
MFTRRRLLASAAAATLAPNLPVAPARAAAPLAGAQVPGWYRYKLGDFEITVINDGARSFPLFDGLVPGVDKAEVTKALEAAFLPADKATFLYAPIVVNTGSKLVAIDFGNGPGAYAESKGAFGQLQVNLAAAGIDRGTVDIALVSHFHADHINGLLTADGKPAFPNAEIMVPAAEWAFWMDDGNMSRAPAGRIADLFKNTRRVFDALGRKVAQYGWNKEVAPGITALDAFGHSPGHTAYVVASGGKSLYVQSDVSIHPVLFARNPAWPAFFDQDRAKALETRRKVYDMVVAEKLPVQGYHFPFPGVTHLEKDGDRFRLVPAPWNPSI